MMDPVTVRRIGVLCYALARVLLVFLTRLWHLSHLVTGNAVRLNAANKLTEWLSLDTTCTAIGILGDLNSYASEAPITAMEAAGYVNLEGSDAYSYVFDATIGTLDYFLANSDLSSRVTGTAVWHVNADEADALDYNLDFGKLSTYFDGSVPFRYSDHDPILVGVTSTCASTASPTASPTDSQTASPNAEDTAQPTASPTASPTSSLTDQPTASPTISTPAGPDLVISEYIEGSSNNKAIELCNPSSSDVNLSTESYVLQVYANGASTPFSTIALTGTVPAGGSFVLANPSAASGILTKADQTSGSVTFNGDDAVVLRKGGATGTVADSYGQVGVRVDYGTDKTYRKKSCGIRDVVTTDAFDRTVQYDEFAVDTFDGLKSCPSCCGQSSAAPTGLQSSIPTPSPTASPTTGGVVVSTYRFSLLLWFSAALFHDNMWTFQPPILLNQFLFA